MNYNSLLYMVEKKTAEEYRMDRFKKKYQYNPQKKTIIVDGEEYAVDLDVKSPIMYITDIRDGSKLATVRQTGADISGSENTIHLGSDFF